LNVNDLPYKFNVSHLTTIEIPPTDSAECWINIDYQQFNAKIYCSFEAITPQTLGDFTEDCRKLVARTVKNASAINEKTYENVDNKVYATLFEIEGETASPLQFMLTDSSSRFFRGALYFECKPDADSLAPYTALLRNDVIELIQTFEWK
jgi:gliding motility-associated lipoprotein GldD